MSTYIKFLGWDRFRLTVDETVRHVINISECHYAICFSKVADAQRFNTGDTLFFSRLVRRPNDSRIFATAEVLDFNEPRDKATTSDIQRLPWKEQWPYMRRIQNPVFINGRLENCIALSKLIEKFGANSFTSSQRQIENGFLDFNPRKSLMQQSDIQLTPEAATWLTNEFTKKINWLGKISQEIINDLPRPEIEI